MSGVTSFTIIAVVFIVCLAAVAVVDKLKQK